MTLMNKEEKNFKSNNVVFKWYKRWFNLLYPFGLLVILGYDDTFIPFTLLSCNDESFLVLESLIIIDLIFYSLRKESFVVILRSVTRHLSTRKKKPLIQTMRLLRKLSNMEDSCLVFWLYYKSFIVQVFRVFIFPTLFKTLWYQIRNHIKSR